MPFHVKHQPGLRRVGRLNRRRGHEDCKVLAARVRVPRASVMTARQDRLVHEVLLALCDALDPYGLFELKDQSRADRTHDVRGATLLSVFDVVEVAVFLRVDEQTVPLPGTSGTRLERRSWRGMLTAKFDRPSSRLVGVWYLGRVDLERRGFT